MAADLISFATKEDLKLLGTVAEMNRRFDSLNDKIDSLTRMLGKRFDCEMEKIRRRGCRAYQRKWWSPMRSTRRPLG